MTEMSKAELMQAAAKEAAQIEGSGIIDQASEQTEVVSSEVATTGEAPQQAEKATEEQSNEDAPESPKEEQDDEVKKLEKELRKKYLSQVNKKDQEAKQKSKEADEWKAKYESLLNEGGNLKAVDEIVEKKFQEREIAQEISREREKFFSENTLDSKEKKEVEAIKNKIPDLKWDAAYKLYLATNNPEKLIGSKTKINMSGSAPKSVFNPAQTKADLRSAAEKELNDMLGY